MALDSPDGTSADEGRAESDDAVPDLLDAVEAGGAGRSGAQSGRLAVRIGRRKDRLQTLRVLLGAHLPAPQVVTVAGGHHQGHPEQGAQCGQHQRQHPVGTFHLTACSTTKMFNQSDHVICVT